MTDFCHYHLYLSLFPPFVNVDGGGEDGDKGQLGLRGKQTIGPGLY